MVTRHQSPGWSTWTLAFIVLLLVVIIGLMYLAS
jgi:hypothetical protein